MQISHYTRQMLTAAAIIMIPMVISAQESKKEVHIKVVEDGVVTQDTVYTFSGESPEFDHFNAMAEHRERMEHMQMREKHMIIMKDSAGEDIEWIDADSAHKEIKIIRHTGESGESFNWEEADGPRKEVKVIVHDVDGNMREREVEEIWVTGNGENSPCKTIIIHEGDCDGKVIRGRAGYNGPEGIAPPHRPMKGDKNVKVTTEITKTDGKTVIVKETIIEEPTPPAPPAPVKGKARNKK